MPSTEPHRLIRHAVECVRYAGTLCATGGSRGLCECPPLLESACRTLQRLQSLLVSASSDDSAEMKPAIQLLALQVANFSRLLEGAAGFHRAVWMHAGEEAVLYQPGRLAFHPASENPAEVVG